ncbi:MAG TPA: ABC transporter permease [Acidimicrobiia bacterium]|jgi:peptide/nickel transport system permease protein|nr:ABC transporter permease [Acidimicrobiia bacterium]
MTLGSVKLTRSARVGLAMLAAFVAVGVVGPWLAPDDPQHIVLGARFLAPSTAHWLGTDSKGIDALSQLLYGARGALEVGVAVVAVTAIVGTAVGLVAGWFGGAVDEVAMRIVDVMMAFPGVLMNIAIVATVARPSLGMTIAALCANGWVGYARLVRGEVLSLRERDFVTASLALGASSGHVIRKHLAPNVVGPVLIQAAFGLGGAILAEASLSFLGLGPQLDYSWGAMLEQGTAFLWKPGFAHYALAPGLALMWVVIAANLARDGLADRR